MSDEAQETATTPETRTAAASEDLDHLKILSIFHYVLGGIVALVGCIPMIHFAFGVAMATGGIPAEEGEAAIVGCFLMAIAAFVIFLAWGFAACLVLAGRFLAQRRHYTFCLVVAGVACTMAPLGTVLGIFTILVLVRPSVKALFV